MDTGAVLDCLSNSLLKLLEGRHPGDCINEICQGVALLTQGADGWTHRILTGSTARYIRVGAVEGKIRLIEFAKQISVFPEDLPTLFHVRFGFFDLSLGEHLIGGHARFMHLGAKVERWWVIVRVGGKKGVMKRS